MVGLAIDFKGIWQERRDARLAVGEGHAAGHRPDEAALRATAHLFCHVEPAGSGPASACEAGEGRVEVRT